MLKKVEAKCKRCGKEFCRKRTEQEFCSAQCRNASWKKPRKRRLKGTPLGSVANGPFSSIKTVACKAPSTSDLGAFCATPDRSSDEPNPIGFTLPDGARARVWLASNGDSKIVGELQVLGCGWRIVTCQFPANKVLLHHNGNVATMKREAFKELVAAVRVARPKRRGPSFAVGSLQPNAKCR
jgi:hypothetical protein